VKGSLAKDVVHLCEIYYTPPTKVMGCLLFSGMGDRHPGGCCFCIGACGRRWSNLQVLETARVENDRPTKVDSRTFLAVPVVTRRRSTLGSRALEKKENESNYSIVVLIITSSETLFTA